MPDTLIEKDAIRDLLQHRMRDAERLARIEERLSNMECNARRTNAFLAGLVIMLALAVIYGALGQRGFNAVTRGAAGRAGEIR